MQGVFTNLLGKTFSRLTVIDGPININGRRGAHWICKCSCGKYAKKPIASKSLTGGLTQSCGCLMIERVKKSNSTHKMTKTKTYTSWNSMWRRCTNKSHKSYDSYKHFVPCDRWKSFENFLDDMGIRPDGTTLERIDNLKPYSPENCTWANSLQQALNKKTTIKVEINGELMSVRAACKKFGQNYSRVKARIRAGWDVFDAIYTPKTNKWETKK